MIMFVIVCFSCVGVRGISSQSEDEIGRSNLGLWNGGYFYEYMSKEYVGDSDQGDTITYRIRYRLKHWGSSYTYQVAPVHLYINDEFVTTFQSEVNEHVSNEDRVQGVYDVTMKKGVQNKMELRDTSVSITVINVSGYVYAPLPVYNVVFSDGFGHILKEEKVTKYQHATPPQLPSKDGYEVQGWDQGYTNITSDKHINATWNHIRYRLSVSPNGGVWNGSTSNKSFEQYAGVKREISNPSREGYVFNGWEVEGLGFFDGFVNNLTKAREFDVYYTISTLRQGWRDKSKNGLNTEIASMEAIKIELGNGLDAFFPIQYRMYCQGVGWLDWKQNNETAGTLQSNKRSEGIEIALQGKLSEYYDVEYRSYVESLGWQPWVKNGAFSGTTNQSLALQNVQIRLKRKLTSNPNNNIFYCLSGNASLKATWLPLPHMEAAYDRWFLVQETIQQTDLLRVIKAYDEYQNDISNRIEMIGFEGVRQGVVGDYNVQVRATSNMGNSCKATITIHVVDKLTKENIRGIDATHINELDRNSKWQTKKDILHNKLLSEDVKYSFQLQG